VDLSGRIQINQLVDQNGKYNDTQKRLLMRFLKLPEFYLDPERVEDMVDAIKDWIDADSEVTRFGAEDSYYRMLERPYPCKNAPLEFPEELLLIRGITEELYYGTEDRPGIGSFISTYGEGKVNINTADLLVLKAISEEIDEERAMNIVEYREDEDNDLSDTAWYKKVPGMAGVNIPASLLTTSSVYFGITSEATEGAMSKRVTGVVERSKETLKVVSWKVE
jgi:general secretion pathway protein K